MKKIKKKPSKFILALQSLSVFQKILFAIAIGVFIFATFPIIILFLIGMMPTIVLTITEKKNNEKLIIVGTFNLAGCFPYIVALICNFNMNYALNIITNIFPLLVMLSSAAVGLLLYMELPNLLVFLLKATSKQKQKKIETRLNKLTDEWGDEIL